MNTPAFLRDRAGHPDERPRHTAAPFTATQKGLMALCVVLLFLLNACTPAQPLNNPPPDRIFILADAPSGIGSEEGTPTTWPDVIIVRDPAAGLLLDAHFFKESYVVCLGSTGVFKGQGDKTYIEMAAGSRNRLFFENPNMKDQLIIFDVVKNVEDCPRLEQTVEGFPLIPSIPCIIIDPD